MRLALSCVRAQLDSARTSSCSTPGRRHSAGAREPQAAAAGARRGHRRLRARTGADAGGHACRCQRARRRSGYTGRPRKGDRRVLGQRVGGETGKIFGFVGAKGGVGTTTVAVNVAAALAAERESRTLLIDMHQAGGDAAVFVGAEPKFSILDVIANTHRLDQTYLSSVVTQLSRRLDLLASSDRAFGTVDPAQVRAVLEFVAGVHVHRSRLAALGRHGARRARPGHDDFPHREPGAGDSEERRPDGGDTSPAVRAREDQGRDESIGSPGGYRPGPCRTRGRCRRRVFVPERLPAALQALNKGRPLVLDNESDLAASFMKFAGQLAGKPARREGTGRSRRSVRPPDAVANG